MTSDVSPVDLAEFLLARIADDETRARSVQKMNVTTADGPVMPKVWYRGHDGLRFIGDSGDVPIRLITDAEYESMIERCSTPADPDPRVLAECEARRRIVDLHASVDWVGRLVCACCGDVEGTGADWPCATLRLLAQPHAAHPDYRTEWRP